MISHDCFNRQDHLMNIILPVGSPADTSTRIGDHLVPDTSLLPDESPAPRATPRTRTAWVEGARRTVSTHPLAAMAAAFALGSLVARLRR